MATVVFTYDHARDPMNPTQLGNQIATALSLTVDPTVDINPTQITVTGAGVAEANRAAIQALINAYVFDPVWSGGIRAVLLAKASAAIATNNAALALPDPTAANNTFLAIANPTAAQVAAQAKALTNQMNSVIPQLRAAARQSTTLIRVVADVLDSTSGT